MRIAVLADIHGNLRALEAVQADLRTQSPDLVVNLGDHLSGPLQAAATADAIMAESWLNIRGNHDRRLVDRAPEAMRPSDRAAHEQISDRHRAWLRTLPPTREIELGVLLCHGSPASDNQYLLENISPDGRRHLASAEEVLARLGDLRPALLLCGHSHIPRAIRAGQMLIVNPGSVGLQAYDDDVPVRHYMENGSPHARYALLDRNGSGWRVSFVALEYDWDAASKEAAAGNRPDWEYALATGYALRPR
jgi:putative phosphoesterase